MPLAVIKFINPRTGQVDPGFGNEAGGGRPDNSLPGYGHPDNDLPGYGHPDNDLPGYGHIDNSLPGYGHIDNGLPWAPVRPDGSPILPPRPWPPLPWTPGANFPPTITDPDWGVGGGPPSHPSVPIYIPGGPDLPDNALPPVAGTKPPQNPPPGTIWPPIAGLPEGKAALLAWFYRAGWRYVVVDVTLKPGMPLPPTPEPK